METKTCIECGLSKTLDDYHKDRTKADGHLNICKPCKLAMKARWQKVNWPRLKDYHSEWDRTSRKKRPRKPHSCPSCGGDMIGNGRCAACRSVPKPISERQKKRDLLASGFKVCSECGMKKSVSDFTQNGHSLNSKCKPCKGKQIYRWQKAYRQTHDGRLKTNKNTADYRRTVKGKAIMQALGIRRREAENGLDSSFTKDDAIFIYRQFNFECFNCKAKKDRTIDHHRPLSQGNGLTRENAVLLCRSCNSSKGSKAPEEFYSPAQMWALACMGKA